MSAATVGGLFADEEFEDLLAGLDDGSEHMSGGEDSAGHGEHDDEHVDDGFTEPYEDEGPLKKTKPLLPWSHEEIVLGWMSVATILHLHAEDGCDGAAILCRGGYLTAHEVLYRFQCAFANRLLCEWQLEVRIPFDQKAAARQYQRLHPDCDESAFDAILHNHQTMAVAPLAARALVLLVGLSSWHSWHSRHMMAYVGSASTRDLCRQRAVLVTLSVCATAQARFWNGHQHRRKTNKLLFAHCVRPLQAFFRAVPGSGLGHLNLGYLKHAYQPTSPQPKSRPCTHASCTLQ